MQIGTTIDYRGDFHESLTEIVELERVGLDVVFVAEAYTFDAVSQLAYLAARTDRVQLASGVLPLFTRTPTLTAMTAAGLDYVSHGRFVLGLGTSGPQVIEGFHGVRFDAPVARTRELIEICRQVWRGERVEHVGTHYRVPLTAEEGGTGLGKPLKLTNTPLRGRIPIVLGAMGPKNVALAAELAEGWLPAFFHPERAPAAFGAALATGRARRDPALGPLRIYASPALAIGDDVDHLLDRVRSQLAFSIGAMGARGRNYYNDLARAYGYESAADKVQEHYLAGRRNEAAQAVPDDLVRATSLIGSVEYIRDRVAAFAAAGVTTLNVRPLAGDRASRVGLVAQLRSMVA